jgi:hypothetical protein
VLSTNPADENRTMFEEEVSEMPSEIMSEKFIWVLRARYHELSDESQFHLNFIFDTTCNAMQCNAVQCNAIFDAFLMGIFFTI